MNDAKALKAIEDFFKNRGWYVEHVPDDHPFLVPGYWLERSNVEEGFRPTELLEAINSALR
jgi:hypothetical protein